MNPFTTDGSFATPDANGNTLRRLTVTGAGTTLIAGGLTLAIQVTATIVLARLLSPRDFGLVAMVTTFSLLLVNFGFNGITEAIVQREEMNHALASTLFWINVFFGAILTIVFAEAGTLLAWLYHEPIVKGVAAGISLTIFAASISTVPLALLKRAMLFTWVSINDICARIVSVALSIFLGWIGWGYWALVAGMVALSTSTLIGAWILCRWAPGRPGRAVGTGSVLRFALHTYGNFAVNYASRNTDNLLIGGRFNAQALGFYKKAYDLFALSANQFVSSIAIVVVAGLSRVNKDKTLYRRYLLDAVAIMAFVGMGLGAELTLVGRDLIYVLLGPKWNMAGQIFTFFGPGIGIMIIYATHGWIHLSIGRPDRWFRWAIIEFVVTLSMFVIGLHWGPIGIATAWSASFWCLTFPALWYAGRPISLTGGAFFGAVWRYIAASLFTAGVTALVMMHTQIAAMGGVSGALLRIVFTSTLAVLMYVGAVLVFHGGFAPIRNFLRLLMEMNGARGRKSSSETESVNDPVSVVAAHVGAMGELPLVSILIPAYNAQDWIADTLRSALAQTWPRIEIVVVDDGSKDNTVAIARQFESFGVQVYIQKNQGASAARNFAYAHCHGDYIQWLDADDIMAPEKIEEQMKPVLQGLSRRTLLSGRWGYFMYRLNRAHFISTDLWRDLSPLEWLITKMQKNVFIQTGAWLVSRELTEAAGPWDVRLLGDDDGEYFCRILLASDFVKFVPDANVYYRAFRFDGLSYIGRFPEKIEAHWLSMQLHIKYLRSIQNDERTRAACVQYLRDNLIYFYPERSQIVAQAEQLAEELGYSLGKPKLSWKFSWIEPIFGWIVTKPIQQTARRCRWRVVRKVDYILFKLEQQTRSTSASLLSEDDPADAELSQLAVKENQTV